MHASRTYLLFILMAAFVPSALQAQDVIKHAQPAEALGQRWAWAVDQAQQRSLQEGYWVGYSITRLMHENSYIGHFDGGRRQKHPTLAELLDGKTAVFDDLPTSDEDVRTAARRALEQQRGEEETEKVEKEVAFLFRMKPGSSEVEDVVVSNVSLYVDLKNRPLLWLGHAEDAQSLALLDGLFGEAPRHEVKKDLAMAIGVHEDHARVLPLLQKILVSQEADDVREAAAFWMGQLDDAAALDVLIRTAKEDRSQSVRKQAVFAISQVNLDAAVEALIDLAKGAEDRGVREQAIFWLGQEASEKATQALSDFVFSEDDTEVQEQAVFALSQLPHDEGIPLLINVARTHQNPEVRKKAIFWLGQSGDPRALDVLIELARGQ